jgi:hemerythrin
MQHKQLLDLLNILYSIDIGEGVKAPSDILFQLVVFTETHFAYEERLLDLVGFPNIRKHKSYHYVMKLKTREIVQNYTKKHAFDKEEVLFFLRDWWVNHILIEDKKYEPLLVSHGLADS